MIYTLFEYRYHRINSNLYYYYYYYFLLNNVCGVQSLKSKYAHDLISPE